MADDVALSNRSYCFTRDTLVQTADGPRQIGTITAGDEVYSFDFETGEWGLRPVIERLDSIYDGPLVTVETASDSIQATAYHPFWVFAGRDLKERPHCRELHPLENQGQRLEGRWVNSHDLRAGDVVYGRNGEHQSVQRVSQVYNPEVSVSNLTVEGIHNYSVGQSGILVHNTTWCSEEVADIASRIGNQSQLDDVLRKAIEDGIPRQNLDELIAAVDSASGIRPSQSVLDAVAAIPIAGNGARFADNAKLQDHFARHGSDFGAPSAQQYEAMADGFLTGPRQAGVLEKTRPNGDVIRFNPATDEFGVVSRRGIIRTYYKPDPSVHGYPTNLDYFNAQ